MHEHIYARIGRQTLGQRPIVCGRPNEPHPAAFLPLPQFVEHAVLAKHHIWVVVRMNVFDEENVNQPDTQESGQLSPRRPQPCDPPAAASGGHDDLLALLRDQRGQLVDKRRVTRPVEEEIIDPTCKRPTNAPRILLRPRGESQATCRRAVESCETAVGGGVERLHRTDVVADLANGSKVRIGASDGWFPWSGSLLIRLSNRSFRRSASVATSVMSTGPAFYMGPEPGSAGLRLLILGGTSMSSGLVSRRFARWRTTEGTTAKLAPRDRSATYS